MRTTFGTFTIATSGLFASQRSLDITSHNISNSNTEGYSRQRVIQRATVPIGGDPTGIIGTGVETYDILRFRSEYLDQKYWGQAKSHAEWRVKTEGLEDIEAIFNEPSDTGIRKVMDEFFASIEELTKKSEDITNRVAVIEKAQTFVASINTMGRQLIDSIRETNFTVKNKVYEVNSLAEQITNLNKQIFNMELGGNKANDLRDQRGLLVDKLSALADISVSEITGENNSKYFNISLGGITLVNHYNRNKLTVHNEPVPGVSDLGAGDISQIRWEAPDGSTLGAVKITGGELRGLLDVRDGDFDKNAYRGLPYYLNQLNRFARDFAREFNVQHKAGLDINGNQGGNFFDEPSGAFAENWKNITCINFKVSSTLRSDPALLAAASQKDGISNNENAKMLVGFRSKKDIFFDLSGGQKINGTPDDFVKSFLSTLAVDSNQAKRMSKNTEAIVVQTNIKRMSESGVSIDEEMSNMVKFQHSYNASARMVTTLDKVLDTMINRLGLVGR